MKRIVFIGLAVAAGGGFMGGVAQAAEPAADVARRCSQILGERERLACYDRAFPAGPETSALATTAAPAAAAVPATAVPAAAAAPTAAAPAAASTAPVAAAATTAGVAAAAAAPSLGDEQVKRSIKEKEAARPPESKSLTATISGLQEVRTDTWRMTLENGQVWQQMDMSSSFMPKVGDTVQIEKGVLGGYSLALAGNRSSRWVRVTRVE